jgi:hypothetical protein
MIKDLDPNFDYDVEAFRGETKDYRTLSGGRGYFGSPQSGNAETGEKIVAIRGRNIARVILKAWGIASSEFLPPRTQGAEQGSNRKQRKVNKGKER